MNYRVASLLEITKVSLIKSKIQGGKGHRTMALTILKLRYHIFWLKRFGYFFEVIGQFFINNFDLEFLLVLV